MNGAEIKAWRKSLGYTQEEMAVHVLGINAATLRRWELGHTQPSSMAQKLIGEIRERMIKREVSDGTHS